MKLLNLIVVLLISFCVHAQEDSTEVYKLSDNYVEIKSLRQVLTIETALDSLDFGSWSVSYIPKPVSLKNGTVVIKDRHDSLLALYIYADSAIIQEDRYKHGKLLRQFIEYPKDSITIQKYYWDNGNIKDIVVYNNGQLVHDFPEDGKLKDRFIAVFDQLFSGSDNRIELGCGWVGTVSVNIYNTAFLIKHKKSDLLFQLLSSKTPATQYLAAEALLIMHKEQKLDSVVMAKIEELKTSNKKIAFCSGCIGFGSFSIKYLLTHKGKYNYANSVRSMLK